MDCQSPDANTKSLRRNLCTAQVQFDDGKNALNQLFNSLKKKTPKSPTIATDAWSFIPSTDPKASFPWTVYHRHQTQQIHTQALNIKDTLNTLCDDTSLRIPLDEQQNCDDKLSKCVNDYTTRSAEIKNWITLFKLLEKSLLNRPSSHEQDVCTPLLHPTPKPRALDCCVIS